MPGDKVEAHGKTACVGVNGEIEHGSAMIHTLRFGTFSATPSAVRPTWNSPTPAPPRRSGPGALLSLPMIHRSESGKRSHFLTASFQIADAPGPDEILIAIGASDGGRAHPRIADRFQDIAEMEAEAALTTA
jgi:hypothetical protein